MNSGAGDGKAVQWIAKRGRNWWEFWRILTLRLQSIAIATMVSRIRTSACVKAICANFLAALSDARPAHHSAQDW